MIGYLITGIVIGLALGYWICLKIKGEKTTVEDCLTFLKDKGYWVRIGPK